MNCSNLFPGNGWLWSPLIVTPTLTKQMYGHTESHSGKYSHSEIIHTGKFHVLLILLFGCKKEIAYHALNLLQQKSKIQLKCTRFIFIQLMASMKCYYQSYSYEILLSTWNKDPEKRPSFSHLLTSFANQQGYCSYP